MTRDEVKVMSKREKVKVLKSKFDLNLKPPYPVETATKPYLVGYIVSHFQKFGERKGNMREPVVQLVDSMGASYNDHNLSYEISPNPS